MSHERGTFASSVFTLTNSAVGSGILAFPFAFRCGGILGGSIMSIFFGLTNTWSLTLIIEACHSTNSTNYQQIIRKLCGHRAETVVGALIFLYAWLADVGFFIIIADLLRPLLILWIGDGLWTQRWFILAVASILILPLMLLRRITSLQLSSMFALFSILYVVGMISYFGICKISPSLNDEISDDSPSSVSLWPKGTDFVLAVPVTCLALQCHVQVPAIYAEVRPDLRSPEWMKWVIYTSITICLVLYIPAGIFGYVTFNDDTPADILEDKKYPADNAAVELARVCIILTSICCIPLNHFPARLAAYEILRGKYREEVEYKLMLENLREEQQQPADIPSRFYYLEAFCFYVSAYMLALILPDIDVVLDIMGATAGVAVIFILPGIMLYKLNSHANKRRSCAWLLGCLGVVVGLACIGAFVLKTFFEGLL